MRNNSILDVDDLTPSALTGIIDNAVAWKRNPALIPNALAGKSVAAIFEKPSLRTRTSFEVAVVSLGGHPICLQDAEVGLGRRENGADVMRTLASYCALVAARVFDHSVLEEMAHATTLPVVNLLSDLSHPCQILADLLTIREQIRALESVRIAFVGDGNNVANSLVAAAGVCGIEIALGCPVGYEVSSSVIDRAHNNGGVVEQFVDPYEAVVGADIIYTDVWTSMGQESESKARREAFIPYRVDAALMAAAPRARFMHCLPAHRGEEVTMEVIDGPASLVWAQAANRMDATRSLFAHLCADDSIENALR